MSIFVLQIQLAYAGGKSPYESGYDHGCDDADLSPSDRYINEPGKGPSFHTDEFMDGYNAGFDNCSSDGGDDGRDTDGSNSGTNNNGGGSDSGYSVTVNIGDHPFGNKWSYIEVETEDGCSNSDTLPTAGDPSLTFDIPANCGDSIQVCAKSAIVAPYNCRTFSAGEDIYVELDVEGLLD
jgi:hypothetical protein